MNNPGRHGECGDSRGTDHGVDLLFCEKVDQLGKKHSAGRIEDKRDSVRYITNTLIFLGLLGTFWGLITTLGAFDELISGLNIENADIISYMQSGLSAPLSGMATAFTSSLLGLGASLITGFLGHMVGIAHEAIYNELGDYMAAHTHTVNNDACIIPNIDLNKKRITATSTTSNIK